jgi:two-component system chemotaxis response regulator CheB
VEDLSVEKGGERVEIKKKIRVLVVDDSLLFREVLSKGMSSDDLIEVVSTASDPYDARDKIIEYQPDVMTCDVEMPKMNGIEFIKRLMPQYPLPIIVVSAVNGSVFDAMDAGAVDFVAKPDLRSVNSVENFINEMIMKVKIASSAKVLKVRTRTNAADIDNSIAANIDKIIAIGASTGGTEAIHQLLKALPQNVPGIVIVQHIPPDFSRMFAERLNSSLSLNVKEAVTGDLVEMGRVLIAPGDRHMKVVKVGGKYRVECFAGEKMNGHCPSVDILFESVAREAGRNAIGVILTGMGYDGAKGLLSMRRKNARTLGQDEASSVVYGMPKVAYNIGAVEKQKPLDQIAPAICSLLK